MAAIKRQKLADSVIEEIKRMINSGELKEGDKLPNQNDFAAQLGVSRPSLREALHTLSLIGAIEQRPGLGTVIRDVNPALWMEQLSPPLVSDAQASLELIEARRFIEAGVTELAVKNATAENIQIIGKLVGEMAHALQESQPRDYSRLDMEFHHQIAQASHNRYMVHLFVTIRGLMEQFIREAFIVIPGLLDRSLKYHQNIYQGIKERDAQQAVSYMKNHINDIQGALSKHYQSERV
jgi:GntR family transcriptional regulator, transcriptional repressor for pyruvate dehydrogenase complex